MRYTYKTKDTCSMAINFDLEDGKVRNIEFMGGCNGNLKAISKLVDGMSVEEIEEKCAGITCERRPTSCPDQLAKAVRAALNAQN